MAEEKPTILKILFKTDLNGCSWIDRGKRLTNPHLQKYFTDQEWKEFCDGVDSSLNPDTEPEFVRANAKDDVKDAAQGICKCIWSTLIFISVGCCVACCIAASTTGTKNIVQSPQIKACMNTLDKESKKKGNVLLQLVIDGTIAGGAYVQHVKCTIKK